MNSTSETPLYFFEYLLTNLNEFIEERFYLDYQNQLTRVNVDRKSKTITYILNGDKGVEIFHKETESTFLTLRCKQELQKSLNLIEKKINELVSLTGNANVFLTLTESKLILLFEQSSSLKEFNLKYFIELLILDFNKKYNLIYSPSNEFNATVKLISSNTQTPLKGKRVLSFQWKQEPEKLNALYENLTSFLPPFVECEKETFIKAFTKGEMLGDEGIKWICYQAKNKTQPSYVTLYRFTELLFDKNFLLMEDYNDINKILEHVFLSPTGLSIKGKIKSAKREKSNISSRYNELEKIVERLVL